MQVNFRIFSPLKISTACLAQLWKYLASNLCHAMQSIQPENCESPRGLPLIEKKIENVSETPRKGAARGEKSLELPESLPVVEAIILYRRVHPHATTPNATWPPVPLPTNEVMTACHCHGLALSVVHVLR
jgi:hypothetical protein